MPQQLYETMVERAEREQLEEFRLRMGDKLNVDYNRATEVLRLKGVTGLPEELIDADFDNISELVRQREFDPNKYKDSAPAWREFASENPMHLSVLKHDEEWLTQFERAYREMDTTSGFEAFMSHRRQFQRSFAPIGHAWKSSWASNEMIMIGNQAALSGGYTPEQEARLDELRKYQVSHDFGAEWSKPLVWLTKQSANMIVSGERRLYRGAQGAIAGGAMGAWYGAAGGTAILPGGGTAIGATAVGTVGAGIGFASGSIGGGAEIGIELGRGEGYNEYRDMGFNHEDAAWAAEISGTASGVIEATLGQVFFNKLPGVRKLQGTASQQIVKQLMGKESFQQVARRAAFDYGAGVTGEIVTEVLQEASLITMGELLKERTPGVAESLTGGEIADRITEVAIETLKSTFLIAGAGPGQRLVMDGRRARNAENFATVLRSMAEGAQKADMPKSLPDQWQAFVERVQEGSNTEFLQMPVKAFIEHFSVLGVDAETAAQELGITNLEEAKLTGQDVQIPMSKFADKIAGNSQTFNQMLPNLRPHDDAMTLREAEQYVADRDEVMATLEEYSAKVRDAEQDTDIEQIVQDVHTQLVGAGYDEGSAGQLAQIMRGVGVMAKRQGMDPAPLYEQIFGGVRRVTEDAQTKGDDIDVFVDPLLDKLRNKDFPSQNDMFGPSLMDFINASGGIDIGDPELSAMDFELGAQGLGVSKAKLNRWKKEGKGLSHIAEIAAEAGYLPANDENLLIESLREELGGTPIYGTRESGDVTLRDESVLLHDLAAIIDEANIDLDEMTNAQVREKLSKRQTLAQIDTKELRNLTDFIMRQVAMAEESALLGDPFEQGTTETGEPVGNIDTVLARAAAALPLVDETQDFGDLTITDRVQIQETGKRGTETAHAQTKFRQAVKRKNVIKKLLDCVSG